MVGLSTGLFQPIAAEDVAAIVATCGHEAVACHPWERLTPPSDPSVKNKLGRKHLALHRFERTSR